MDKDNFDLGRYFGAIHNGVGRYMENYACRGDVTAKNGWIIMYLHKNRDKVVYQKDLEKEFNITRSTASKVVILMEKKGLVERLSVEGDARLKQLVLTDRGEAYVQEIEKNRMKMDAVLQAGFSEEEMGVFRGYLMRVIDNLEKAEKEGYK